MEDESCRKYRLTSIQKLKEWQKIKPGLFNKQDYDLAGLDM
jgi:hypothetical protein